MVGAAAFVCQLLVLLSGRPFAGTALGPRTALAASLGFLSWNAGNAARVEGRSEAQHQGHAQLGLDAGEARGIDQDGSNGAQLGHQLRSRGIEGEAIDEASSSQPELWSVALVKQETASALGKARQLFKDMEIAALSGLVLAIAAGGIIFYCWNMNRQSRLLDLRLGSDNEPLPEPVCSGETKEPPHSQEELQAQPLLVIMALTLYRFHTGFLGATWVPFFIAKEAEILTPTRQTVFMGEEKLIYGLSLCFNPLFGLLSDRLTSVTRFYGRSTFLIVGVFVAGSGIYIAKIASDAADVSWYLAASAVWMVGEAMADTTTEAVVPDLLPSCQYDLASTVRSLQSFLGCFSGLLCLIIFRDFHHHWLYPAYIVMMMACAFATAVPALLLHSRAGPVQVHSRAEGFSFLGSLWEAYATPLQQSGNFSRACLATFFFSLGTAPVFFTLPLVRDLIGISDESDQQMHFSLVSIVFLLSAVVGTLALTFVGGGSSNQESSEEQERKEKERKERRWTHMGWCTAFYGISVLGYPLVGLTDDFHTNLVILYTVSSCLGLAYGTVYSLVQTCTWSIIPEGANIANWMGVFGLSKVTGCGIGNFLAGLMLDRFKRDVGSEHVSVLGYAVMSWFCTGCVFLSVAVIWNLQRRIMASAA